MARHHGFKLSKAAATLGSSGSDAWAKTQAAGILANHKPSALLARPLRACILLLCG